MRPLLASTPSSAPTTSGKSPTLDCCSGEGKTFFNDPECAATPRWGTLFALNFSAAYLLTDFGLTLKHSGCESTLDKMNLLHHLLAFFFMYLTEVPQDFTLVFAVSLLFMEVTAVFTSARWLMFEHGVSGGSWQQSLNSVCLFLTFLLCRVAFETYVFLRAGLPYIARVFGQQDAADHFSGGYKVMLFFMGLSVLVNYALNWYWMYLILMQVARILQRGLKEDDEFVAASPADKQDTLTAPLLQEASNSDEEPTA